MADTILEEPRNVSIRLRNQIGRFVKIELFFSNVWLSVSEVQFSSMVAEGSFPHEKPPNKEVVPANQPAHISEESPTASTPALPSVIEDREVKNDVNILDGGLGKSEKSSPTSAAMEVEVVIGALTAVTLLLLFMFLMILLYSRRQKFLHSPTSRTLHAFPPQINMKELLTASPVLSGSSHSPNPLASMDYEQYRHEVQQQHQQLQQPTRTFFLEQQQQAARSFEDCRSKWHSTGHVADLGPTAASTGFRGFGRSSMASTANITSNPMCSEYASVDVQNLGGVGGSGVVIRGMHPSSATTAGLPILPLQAAPLQPPPPPQNEQPQPQTAYNLGSYFPRVSSEPPQRKSYQNAASGNRASDLKVGGLGI